MKNLILIGFIGIGMTLLPLTGWAETKSVEITVSATVLPMLELSVSGPAGGNIEFGAIERSPNGAVTLQSKEVVVEAKTNLYKPYQITQTLVEPFSQTGGEGTFGEEDLTVDAESASGKGSPAKGLKVGTSPTTLFTSSADGQGDTIKANYKLNVKPTQPSGDYRTKLIYSITTF